LIRQYHKKIEKEMDFIAKKYLIYLRMSSSRKLTNFTMQRSSISKYEGIIADITASSMQMKGKL